MSMIEHKSHGHHLFSFDEVDESSIGKNRLSEFLSSLVQASEAVVCLCERPLLNESVKELIRHKNLASSLLQGVEYDDFELSFTYTESGNSNDVVNLLSDCFYFFEHPAFIFLNNESDVVACKAFCDREKKWTDITDNIKCCFVFKSVEDEVVWYRVSPK